MMQKINQDYIKMTGHTVSKCGRALKGCLRLEFANMDKAKVSSYAEAWEMLKPIRETVGM
jgi:uncharacterized Zn finger protein